MNAEEKDNKDENANDALGLKFLKTRQILLTGEVNKTLAEKIIRQLLILEADNDKPIYIFIDSPGGDVAAGYAIF
ncbi:MAG: ATP-dependent Clp protease proteolytic subunit, partial [Spirochaetales bacterium]